jgi:elongation factor P
MAQASTNEFKPGMKLEIEGQPFVIVNNEFVKPGKGQAFNRVKLKNLLTARTIERTFKSGDKAELADVQETQMRLLYNDQEHAVFMDDNTFEQVSIAHDSLGDTEQWLMEDHLFDILFYKGEAVAVEPPTFLDMVITETEPGAKGDTASGRVLKPATTESGAKVQIPIFIEQGEKVRIDTRTGEYVSRVTGKK